MIARVAENCFWLNRYVERVATLSRLVDVNRAFVLDVDVPSVERWRPLVAVLDEEARFSKKHGLKAVENDDLVESYLTWDTDSPSSIVFTLERARENARVIRETVSLEVWETINGVWTWIDTPPARKLFDRDRHSFYAFIQERCQLFHGVCHNTMLHEEPFDFMRLGTALERAGQTLRILDIKAQRFGPAMAGPETPADAAQWLATLRSCSGIEPFLKRSANVLTGRNVAAFLLFDEPFPRSVLHNLERARNFLALIRKGAPPQVARKSAAKLDALCQRVHALTIEEVIRRGIDVTLEALVVSIADVCAALAADFFEPLGPGEKTKRRGTARAAAGAP